MSAHDRSESGPALAQYDRAVENAPVWSRTTNMHMVDEAPKIWHTREAGAVPADLDGKPRPIALEHHRGREEPRPARARRRDCADRRSSADRARRGVRLREVDPLRSPQNDETAPPRVSGRGGSVRVTGTIRYDARARVGGLARSSPGEDEGASTRARITPQWPPPDYHERRS